MWTSYISFRTALRKQDAAVALLESANISYSASLDAYNYGVKNLVDVLTAEKQLAQARLSSVSARSQLFVEAVRLEFVTGESTAGQAMNYKALFAPALFLLLAGCSRAPSVDVWGSFFPVWMVCLTIASACHLCCALLLLRWRLESEVGPLALFYPCAVMLFTGLLWFISFDD